MSTALIFFDSPFLSDIVQRMIVDLGFDSVVISDAKKFSEELSDKKIDVALTDAFYQGKENPFLNKLKEKKVPFLIISDKEDPDDIKKALKKGAEEYIIKPFDHDILQSKLSIMGIIK